MGPDKIDPQGTASLDPASPAWSSRPCATGSPFSYALMAAASDGEAPTVDPASLPKGFKASCHFGPVCTPKHFFQKKMFACCFLSFVLICSTACQNIEFEISFEIPHCWYPFSACTHAWTNVIDHAGLQFHSSLPEASGPHAIGTPLHHALYGCTSKWRTLDSNSLSLHLCHKLQNH